MRQSIAKGLLVLGIPLLTACPPSEQHTGPSPSPDQTPSPQVSQILSSSLPSRSAAPSHSPPRSPVPKSILYRGIFMAGDGLQLFKSCGSQDELWVEDPQGELMKRHAALKGLIDLEPVYLEMLASAQKLTSGEGFSSGYRKALRVDQVRVLRPWVPDGHCFPLEFVARGHRPEWSLQVLKHNQIFFKSVEGEFPVVESMHWQAPVIEGNQWKYTFRYRSGETETLQALFRREPCQDGAKTYDFKAQVNFRGITYEGCARHWE